MTVNGTHGFEKEKKTYTDKPVSARATGFNYFCLCMHFFSLKAVSPIDGHYMSDRLQRFELNIFVCVLLKKQSHLHLGCPWGKQMNITFSFLGELSL